MFNNANVLYRVRFVDGTSTVTRYAHESEENAAEGKRRPSAKGTAARALAPANR